MVPSSTVGWAVAEGYLHGMNSVAEAVWQAQGAAGPTQVDGCEVALTCSGGFMSDRPWYSRGTITRGAHRAPRGGCRYDARRAMPEALDLPPCSRHARRTSWLLSNVSSRRCRREVFSLRSDALKISDMTAGGICIAGRYRRRVRPDLAPELPYVVAVSRLRGGARVWARIVGVDPAGDVLAAELPVELDRKATRQSDCLVFRPSVGR